MAYISVREAAAAWGVSERLVQRYCAQGRIAGARKFGVSWEIPAGTPKPADPRAGLPLILRIAYRAWLGCAKLKFGRHLQMCPNES